MIQKRVKVRKLNNGQRKKTHSTALSFFVWTSTSTNWKCASVITNYLIFIGQTFSRPDFELGRLSFRKFEEIGFETFAARPGLDNLDGKYQMKKWLRLIISLPFSSLSSVKNLIGNFVMQIDFKQDDNLENKRKILLTLLSVSIHKTII